MSSPRTICVDANLVVRRVADPDNRSVQSLWDGWDADGTTLVAPRLVLYEITNALHRSRGQRMLSLEVVRSLLGTVLLLPIRLHDDEPLHLRALELADEFGLAAAYDAHYLALAEGLGVEFWTSDLKLAGKVGAAPPWVRSLVVRAE